MSRASAIHEAGHAVIGRVLALPCGPVSLVQEVGAELGYAVIENPLLRWERGDGPKQALAEDFCVALFAGGEAERAFAESADVGDSTDCERVTSCLSMIGVRGASFVGDNRWNRYERRLRERARKLVNKYRSEIEHVADALLKRSSLDAAEIDKMLAAST